MKHNTNLERNGMSSAGRNDLLVTSHVSSLWKIFSLLPPPILESGLSLDEAVPELRRMFNCLVC